MEKQDKQLSQKQSLRYMIKNVSPHFYVVNLLAIFGYFLVLLNLKAGISLDIMYSSSDAGTYIEVANWIFSGEDSKFVEHRPFLFPLILLVLSKIGGVTAIWFFQFSLWLLTINLLFESIRKITKKTLLAYAGAIALMINLSVITLTLHALTEITTLFLLTFFVSFFTKNSSRRKELFFIHRIILFLVILTVIKPVFFFPLLFILGIITPLFYFRHYVKRPVKIVTLLLILLPLLVQITIMHVKYDSVSVSNISERTFTRYLLTKGIQEIENIDNRNEAIEMAESFTAEEKKKYFISHFSVFHSIFWKNIEENIKSKSTFLSYPVGYENYSLATKMKIMNKVYYFIHLLFLPLCLFLFVILLYKKMNTDAIILFCLYGLCGYYIFVSGISFYQGDRLVISVISVWIFVYLFVINNYIKWIKGFKKIPQSFNEPKI